MGDLEDGTIIRLSYDMWLEDYEGLFDTTSRETASESGIFNPEHPYGAVVTVVGAGRLVPGLEKAVKEKGEVGKEVEVELAPEEAYGRRDPKNIETVPMQRLKQAKIVPKVGERIRYKDRPATITRVSGGRVWIDTNSPLAGRKVTYKFKVDEVVDGPKEQVEALLEMGYKPEAGFDIEVHGKERVDILVPDQAKYDQRFLVAKFRLAHDIGRYTDFEKVRFVEEFTTEPVGDTQATDLSAEEKAAVEEGQGGSEAQGSEAEKPAEA